MIKVIESETLKLTYLTEDRIALNFECTDGRSPREIVFTADELNDLMGITNHYWNANNMWQQTSEAKADRARCENERYNGLTLTGQAQNAMIR